MGCIWRFTLIFFFVLGVGSTHGESISTDKQDSTKASFKNESIDKNEEKILELQTEIVDLTKTVADTKESFYNSRIYLWAFLIAAFALLMVVVGYFGVQSLRNKLVEIRADVENSKNGSIATIAEIKNDLNKRIDELKVDFKDFKQDQKGNLEKFETTASEKIERGLDLALQDAINKIMKGSYGAVVEDLQEQIANLTISLEEIKSSRIDGSSVVEMTKSPQKSLIDKQSNSAPKNAFDEQPE